MIEQWVFYFLSAALVSAATLMISVKNPVHSALLLVLCFVLTSGLWLLLEAEFLALVLIFVYVGAVMTLFLFVVMMLNLDMSKLRVGFVRYLPIGALIVAVMIGLMILVISPLRFGGFTAMEHGAGYSNIKELGMLLYTELAYPFEIAAVMLLVAIIAAIMLTHEGRPKRKGQDVDKQVRVRREDRVRLVKIPAEGKE
jgi:NADH-quinone oxidoreductase subunit J